MMQKSYFQMTLEKTIRQTEKLLKILQAVQTDYADKRMEAAMEKAVSAAKQAEEVALLTRALPAHTGHPRAKELIRSGLFSIRFWNSLQQGENSVTGTAC